MTSPTSGGSGVGPRYEEIHDRFAAWFDLDKSGVHALDELLNTNEAGD